MDKVIKDAPKTKRYKRRPKPNCKDCNGKGEKRTVLPNGGRWVQECHCVTLLDEDGKPIQTFGGIPMSR